MQNRRYNKMQTDWLQHVIDAASDACCVYVCVK